MDADGRTNEAGGPSFAVVITAYDEEAGIEACLTAVDAALAELPNRSGIVVVDDGSTDGTAAKLARLDAALPRLRVVSHRANRGYGAGIRSGTLAAADGGFDYVLFMDSDLTNDPAYLPEFAKWMAAGCDVVKASRYVDGGGVRGVPAWRAAVSVLGNAVARLLFGVPVRDCTNGFRAVRTRLLLQFEPKETGFAVIMEELHRLRPMATSYAEVPIVLTARSGDLTASSFSFRPAALARYLKYPLLSALARATRSSA